MTRLKTKLILVSLVIFAAALAYVFITRPRPPANVRPDARVTTRDTLVIYRDLPVPGPQRFVDRIVYRDMPPELIITTDTLRDTVAVTEYRDTTTSVLPRLRMAYDGRYLRFNAVLSSGRLFRQDTEVKPPFTVVTEDSTLRVRGERFAFRGLRTIRDCGLAAGIGAVIGTVAGGSDDWQRRAIAGAATGCLVTIAF